MAKMAKDNRALALVAMVAMAVALTVSALVPVSALAVSGITDPTVKDSTITIKPKSTDGAEVGGTFSIYKVAEVKTASEAGDTSGDNAYHYVWTSDYAADGNASGVDIYDQVTEFSESDRTTLASKLSAKGQPYATATANSEGVVSFSVEPGLYLVVQTKTASGYDVINPFVYAVPGNGLTLNATPKAGRASKVSTPKNPSKTPKASTPSYTHSSSAKLPQTGQLWWPVWILGAAGGALLVIGLVARSRSGQENRPAKA